VAGKPQVKPGVMVLPDAELVLSPGASAFVSRGGIKLAVALDEFGFDPKGRVALDISASTGGFTDVLIARGAAKVYAVDVDRGRLHDKLRGQPQRSSPWRAPMRVTWTAR
jgi:23S rRNA (cytidine1920-2'-O)/16S rRNA (cytidine1409-2'-O)-methyltransferase